MVVRIISVSNVYVSPSPSNSAKKYMHAAANIIAANNPLSPAIESIKGILVFEAASKVLFSITGDAALTINGKEAEPWRSYTLMPGSRVEAKGSFYASFHGLNVETGGSRVPLSPGMILNCNTVNGDFGAKKLLALKVPVTMRFEAPDWRDMVRRLQKHVALAREAVEKGAELVRVRVGGREFELWVQELV